LIKNILHELEFCLITILLIRVVKGILEMAEREKDFIVMKLLTIIWPQILSIIEQKKWYRLTPIPFNRLKSVVS